MLNVTDQYCISPATSKGEFSFHPADLSRKCHLCHGRHVTHESEAQGLLPRVTRQSETFYHREWRVCPHLCWDNVLEYLVFPALYALF